jgi:hypothetical protein
MYSGQGENSIRENLQLRREQLELEAVAYYQSTLEDDEDDKNLTVQQYRDKLINSGTIGQAHETFENAVISGLEERSKREKAVNAAKKTSSKPTSISISSFNVVGAEGNKSIPLTQARLGSVQEGSIQYAKLDEKGALVVAIKKDDEIEEYEAVNYSELLDKAFGPNSVSRMTERLGGKFQAVDTSSY